jgi:hypothetical protein
VGHTSKLSENLKKEKKKKKKKQCGNSSPDPWKQSCKFLVLKNHHTIVELLYNVLHRAGVGYFLNVWSIT